MSENNETIADIVAAMREMSKVSENFAERFSNPCLRTAMEMEAKMRKSLADRIESAWKREEEHAVEHATSHAEAVARDNCRDCVHNPQGHNYEGGNAAKMREALEEIRVAAMSDYEWDADYLIEKCNAALSAPAEEREGETDGK